MPEVEPHIELVIMFDEDYKVSCSLERIIEEVGSCVDAFNRGCFEWMGSNDFGGQSEVPASPAFFCCAADKAVEIHMTVAPRDVHCQKRNGIAEWALNQKPKKNAEVSFKWLSPEDKAEMKAAMKAEINSFLEREAIKIASRQGIDPQKLLSMRWVLIISP